MAESGHPRPGSAGFDGSDGGSRDVVVNLVPLRRRHLRAVLQIEQQVYPRPWSFGVFMSELNLRGSRHYVAARTSGRIAGYAGLMFGYEESHVTNIAVDPRWQRHGIGTRLMVNLFCSSLARRARQMTLEVRVSNTAAQAMYRRFGFEVEGVRKNYYSESNEDALVMWARDIDSPSARARLAAIAGPLTATTVDETGLSNLATGPLAGEPEGPR
jgi:ribosomal-protein-alanine N-acetyltransferase